MTDSSIAAAVTAAVERRMRSRRPIIFVRVFRYSNSSRIRVFVCSARATDTVYAQNVYSYPPYSGYIKIING